MKTKVIFVTGGVYSSVGKGLTLSNIGFILKEIGFKVSALKFDPYLNLTAGNLSPIQHGEVYVTSDGYETDLDLGHYERFMECSLSGGSCVTSGTIYSRLFDKQRLQDFKGETIQVFPHVVDEINEHIFSFLDTHKDLDFLFVEIGGTIGDLESNPFLESSVRFQKQYGKSNVMFIHISPLIYLPMLNEYKTKPTQHSVRLLNSFSIIPDILILRSHHNTPSVEKARLKISWVNQIEEENIFICPDNNIYLIAEDLFNRKIHEAILRKFDISMPTSTAGNLMRLSQKVKAEKKHKIRLAMAAKYSSMIDSYISISESFKLAAYDLYTDLEIDCLDVETLVKDPQSLALYDAVCVPHGFGSRGVEEKLKVIEYCRVNKIPFLGICFGMQLSCIEFARNVLNKKDANSVEINPNTTVPLFIPFEDSEMRLGSKEVKLEKGTKMHELFDKEIIAPRHRHRYHFNPDLYSLFEGTDLVFSSFSNDDERVAESIELKNHPFFVAVQFHPEFEANLNYVSPLFFGLLRAGIQGKK